MQILDMEQKTGLDRATIRFYEKEGLVVPKREENGYRIYSEEDLQLLLKIKLLRQLGVSLFKIKTLQQGSGDFSQILDEQIQILEKRIQEDTQAKLVCQQIRNAGVAYSNLDAVYYLKMLETPFHKQELTFQEPVNKESHPVRRFVARMIDVSLLDVLIRFVIVVVLRIRPISEVAMEIIGILSYVAIIPVEAALLHFWGTTPGKWVMGIRLEDVNGGKLSYNDAFIRGMYIIRYGFGFGIPIWEHWRLYRCYTEGEDNPWNEDTEIIYTQWLPIKKLSFVALIAVNIALRLWCGFDAVLPYHRGDLTIQEFAKNYQSYEEMLGYDGSQYYMQADGTWGVRDNANTTIITDTSDHDRVDFTYTYTDGNVTEIHFQDEWQDASFMDTLPYYCRCAIFAFVGSRPGSGIADLPRLEGELESAFYGQFDMEPENGTYTGEIHVNDVQITWKIVLDGVVTIYNGILYSDENIPSTYSLELDIIRAE